MMQEDRFAFKPRSRKIINSLLITMHNDDKHTDFHIMNDYTKESISIEREFPPLGIKRRLGGV